MTANKLIIDRERYPFILRDGKKPICAVYDNASLEKLANVFKASEELAELRIENDRLGKLSLGIDREELLSELQKAYDGPLHLETISNLMKSLRETAPEAPSKAIGVIPKPVGEAPLTIPNEPEVGQIWASKRKKDDLYEVTTIDQNDDQIVISWLGNYEFNRLVTRDGLRKRYSFHSVKETANA